MKKQIPVENKKPILCRRVENKKPIICRQSSNYLIKNEVSQLPYVNLNVGDRVIKSLVDTGADVSVLNLKMFRSLPKNRILKFCKRQKHEINITGVTGNNLNIVGKADVELYLNKTKIVISVYVAENIKQNLILGNDILRQYEILVDIKHNCIVFQNKIIPFSNCGDHIFSVSLIKRITVPRYSQWTVPVRIQNNRAKNKSLFIQGISEVNYFKNRPGVSISSCILNNKHKYANIFIENNSNIPIHLKKGSHVAIAELVSPEDILNTDQNLFSSQEEHAFNLDHLNNFPKEKQNLHNILEKFSNIFITKDAEMTQTNVLKAKIDTNNATPIKGGFYRTPLHLRDQVSDQIDELLKAKIITPSNSNWSFPIVLVKKRDNKNEFRLAIDYRKLNKITKDFNYQIPQITDVFAKLSQKKFFSILDLKNGFYQIGLEESSKEKTAFTCFKGLFQFEVLPFGLKTGLHIFKK